MNLERMARRRTLQADNARLRRLLRQILNRADTWDDEHARSKDIEDWFAAWRPKAAAALDKLPPVASATATPSDDPMHEAAPGLFTVLGEMRDELEAMSGWWTERMANLAQQADQVLDSAGG